MENLVVWLAFLKRLTYLLDEYLVLRLYCKFSGYLGPNSALDWEERQPRNDTIGEINKLLVGCLAYGKKLYMLTSLSRTSLSFYSK